MILVVRNMGLAILQVMIIVFLFVQLDVLILGVIGQLIILQLIWQLQEKVYIVQLWDLVMNLGMALLWPAQMQQVQLVF